MSKLVYAVPIALCFIVASILYLIHTADFDDEDDSKEIVNGIHRVKRGTHYSYGGSSEDEYYNYDCGGFSDSECYYECTKQLNYGDSQCLRKSCFCYSVYVEEYGNKEPFIVHRETPVYKPHPKHKPSYDRGPQHGSGHGYEQEPAYSDHYHAPSYQGEYGSDSGEPYAPIGHKVNTTTTTRKPKYNRTTTTKVPTTTKKTTTKVPTTTSKPTVKTTTKRTNYTTTTKAPQTTTKTTTKRITYTTTPKAPQTTTKTTTKTPATTSKTTKATATTKKPTTAPTTTTVRYNKTTTTITPTTRKRKTTTTMIVRRTSNDTTMYIPTRSTKYVSTPSTTKDSHHGREVEVAPESLFD